ncbi:MAG TPA: aminoacyl--tRNA ligase-related protein, partial [Polyangiaceae bacterium]
MLDIQFIRQNADQVRAAIKNKGFTLDLDELLEADRARREATTALELKRARKNELSAAIPKATKDERPKLVEEAKAIRTELEDLEPKLGEIQKRYQDLMLRVPSLPRPEVPVGKGEEDNVEIRRVGEPRKFDFTPKDHLELMTTLGMVEFDGPRRFAGQRSYALVGDGALLEMAVLRLAVDTLVERGLKLVSPPVMVRERAMVGTGFFPLGREEAYSIPADEVFLIGTSEVPLVSMHCDDVIDEARLPLKYAGISPCFRREAGAHGKDTRGLYRVHQFMKVEQVVVCTPDE